MTAPDLRKPLQPEELDYLDDVLGSIEGRDISNSEALDGFLTALVICPDLIPPSEFMGVIQTGGAEGDGFVFEDLAEVERFFGVVMRHWNTINTTFRSGEPYLPILQEDDEGVAAGNDWAQGFMKGIQLRPEAWAEAMEDEDEGGAFVPIYILAHVHDPDPELRPFEAPMPKEKREDIIMMMAAGVNRLYRLFEEERRERVRDGAMAAGGTYRASGAKVGRNDPCPCGSGKKWKKCCGGMTIH